MWDQVLPARDRIASLPATCYRREHARWRSTAGRLLTVDSLSPFRTGAAEVLLVLHDCRLFTGRWVTG